MNTYVISVLVIFFLQLEHNFPTVDQVLCNDSPIISNESNYKLILRQFFAFYGYHYQMQNHVISAHIGRFQERQIQPAQISFSIAQQRFVLFENNIIIILLRKNFNFKFVHSLLKGIEDSPQNWTNCTMYVQDLVQPDVNITAEISKHDAETFQEICKQFAEIKF